MRKLLIRFAVLPYAKLQKALSLLVPEPAQLFDRERGQGHASRPLGLGRLKPKARFSLLKALDDADDAVIEIHAPPSKRQHLTAPHAGCEREEYRPVDMRVSERRQEYR